MAYQQGFANVFYSAATVQTGAATVTNVSVPWDTQFRGQDYVGRPYVLIQPSLGRDPGLYVFNGTQYLFGINYEDFGKLVSADSTFTVVYNASAAVSVPSGATVWTGGQKVTGLSTIPANTNAVYVIVEAASSSGGSGVTSVNGKTGAVVISATDITTGTFAAAQLVSATSSHIS
jgi:hypothetical protein